MKAIERLYQLLESKDIKPTYFEKEIGMSSGYLSVQKKRSADMGESVILKIIDYFQDLNPIWFLTGNGNMIISEKNDKIQAVPCCEEIKHGIPLIPFPAMAGVFSGEINVLDYECERFIIPSLKDADFMIRVNGLSMFPNYTPGDIVACKKLPLDTFFQWNKVYVVDTDQGAIIKRIRKGSTSDKLLIVSDNPDYENFELSRESIYHIAIVLGGIWLE